MFNKKEVRECPDPFEDKAKCDECRHWVDKSDLQSVMHENYLGMGFVEKLCPIHRVLYEKVMNNGRSVKYYAMREMEVDDKGNLVGYKKVKTRKTK